MARRATISARWRDVLMGVPGFDPIATAKDCRFDPAKAERAIDFFPAFLKHVKGQQFAGQKFKLQPWQESIVANMFGWIRPDGTRRFRECMIFVPRKNGKTALAAGLVLYMLFCDGEPGAEIFSAAADREQAALVYEQAKGMVLQSKSLQEKSKIYVVSKCIEYPATMSAYRAISADAKTKHGYNLHFACIDELHAHRTPELVDVLLTSMGNRTQPMAVHITTADYHREGSVCNQKRDYAIKVRDGVIEDFAFLPVIYEASVNDDWKDPKVWARANPNLGVSISQEFLERECKRAQEEPSYQNQFLRLHLNITTDQSEVWLPMDRWDQCGEKFDPGILDGETCYAGLDLSATTDLTSLMLLFPREDHYFVLPFFWVPGQSATRRERRDRVPYPAWIRNGYMEETEGETVDYDLIRNRINELRDRYNIVELAADRWNATQILTQLMGDGLEVVAFGQGFKDMTAPSKELEALVMDRRIHHAGHPVLRWNASNCVIERDAAGNIKPSKKVSTERIDGMVALIMALGRAMVRSPVADQSCVFI